MYLKIRKSVTQLENFITEAIVDFLNTEQQPLDFNCVEEVLQFNL